MKLSIAIPTYNRSEILEVWLSKHAAMLNRYNVDLYISDNKSTDATRQIVKEWSLLHDNIYYSSTEETLKAEYNFERCVNLASEGWIWMVGDSYEISEETIKKVIGALECNYDYIILNLLGRVRYKQTKEVTIDIAVAELSGVISCISCVIYNLNRLEKISLSTKDDSFYPHMINILEGIYKRAEKAIWHQELSVQMLELETPRKNWANTQSVYKIAALGWIEAIDSIKQINKSTQLKGYKQFGKISGLFKLSGFLLLRSQGLLDTNVLNRYKKEIKLVSNVNIYIVIAITLIPIKILSVIFIKLGVKKINQ